MRTLHLLASANRRGAEVFGTELAQALTAPDSQHDVVALEATSGTAALDVQVLPALGSISGMRELRRLVRRADVVLGHGSRGLVAGTLATVGTRTPFVYRSIGDPAFWQASRSRRMRVGVQLRRAARVTALWPDAANTMTELYGLRPSSTVVIPNAADQRRFSPPTPTQRSEARKRLGQADNATVVAYVGSLSAEKRPQLAIEALAHLPNATLILAGAGPDAPAVRALADATLGDRCRVLGAVDETVDIYHASDVLVLTSSTEGQPGVAIEAGLCGLPVVATDVGGVASVIEDQTTGILVDADPTPADIARAIETALDRRQTLGQAARARTTQQFSMAAVSRQFDQTLRQAIEGPGKAAT